MQDWRARREARGDNGDGGGRGPRGGDGGQGAPGGGGPGGGDPSNPNQRPRRTPEERLTSMKQNLDHSTTEARAARDTYFRDMQARRTQLGLPPMQGPGGFGGGFGGGRGR
jgi:hypothetical protein